MSTLLASQLSDLTLYYLTSIYVTGVLGNIFNVIIFLCRNLRSNGCGYDFGRTEIILCKFRSYIYVLALVLVRQFLCLISIDRWIVSTKNVRIRRLSSPHVVRWLIFGSILFWILFSIHALIGYQALLIRGCALFYSIQLTVS